MSSIKYQEENEWGGGWLYGRIAFAIVAIVNLTPRFFQTNDLFGGNDMRFSNGWFAFAKIYEISSIEALTCCFISLFGLMGVARGGKTFHVGLLLWFICNGIYITSEALNVKAYDRLLFFIALVLLVSPAYKKNLGSIYVSPMPRRLMLTVFSTLYLSTGMLKLIHEPGWLNGEALAYALNHRWHASSELALWLSTQSAVMLFGGIATVVFEITAGTLLWFERYNRLIIILGLGFHICIEAVMNVGTFGLAALSAYPILISPNALFSFLRTKSIIKNI